MLKKNTIFLEIFKNVEDGDEYDAADDDTDDDVIYPPIDYS